MLVKNLCKYDCGKKTTYYIGKDCHNTIDLHRHLSKISVRGD